MEGDLGAKGGVFDELVDLEIAGLPSVGVVGGPWDGALVHDDVLGVKAGEELGSNGSGIVGEARVRRRVWPVESVVRDEDALLGRREHFAPHVSRAVVAVARTGHGRHRLDAGDLL